MSLHPNDSMGLIEFSRLVGFETMGELANYLYFECDIPYYMECVMGKTRVVLKQEGELPQDIRDELIGCIPTENTLDGDQGTYCIESYVTEHVFLYKMRFSREDVYASIPALAPAGSTERDVVKSLEYKFRQWEAALQQYESSEKIRKNDARAQRIRKLLHSIDSKAATVACGPPPTVGSNSDISKARSEDIPFMIERFKNLPALF